jgi:four helix bundle protein
MREDIKGFRSVVVWQKAQELVVQVVQLLRSLPRDRAAETVANQLLRATASVSANIAEGYGRYSNGAYRNHLSIARGSLFEAESWIDLLSRSGYLEPDETSSLLEQCHEVGRLLTAQMRGLTSSVRETRIREEGPNYEV